MQASFGGIGQIFGPLIGIGLYMISPSVPFYVTGGLLIATALTGLNNSSKKILHKKIRAFHKNKILNVKPVQQ